MSRNLMRAASTFLAAIWLMPLGLAETKPAYELFPANAQAVVWIPDAERLALQWEQTQLYKLANDPTVAPFFEEQRQEIEKKLVDAGWRLNIKPEDLRSFSKGQIALAWMENPTVPRKPYSMALIAEVAQQQLDNQKLLSRIDAELAGRQATKSLQAHLGFEIAKYTLPKRADSLLAEEGYYAIVDGLFISTDDNELIKDIIGRAKGQSIAGQVIGEDPVFKAGRELLQVSSKANVEYFVRPLGLARVLRSIGGKRSKSSADPLAVLQNQGFDAVKCVCGEIAFGLETLDIAHRGYVLADRPLPKSAAILSFPNEASDEVPSFVGKNISSLLSTNWNAKDAFWEVKGLVDEMAGTDGVFDEVIKGIKMDTNGPRIDIANEVLPHFTNDILAISDNKEGDADVDSRRNLIALRLSNPQAMSKVIDRVMQVEPDAELVEVSGHKIWKVVHQDDEEVVDLAADFGSDFGAPPAAAQGKEAPEPWLSNWAITVYGDYLMFASHVEMIEEALSQGKVNRNSPLVTDPEYIRVKSAIEEHFGEEAGSAWQIVRTSSAYRVQYELFREGKLRQSQSMLASILDRLLQNESEMRGKEQRLNGSKLPPFERISAFLQPTGMKVRSTDRGWEFGSLMLSGGADETGQDLTLGSRQGTARAEKADLGANR